MSQLAIMDRDLTAFFMTPDVLVTREAYEYDKAYHLRPGSYMYGAVLVEMRDEPDGFSLTLGIQPSGFSWRSRFTAYRRSASWLWFTFSWERKYRMVPGRIIADHLAEQQSKEKK
ncbi:hypothetical protein [Aeromonas hydrophila]|uniref:hypothetical protein n=1 Tax=Aeromonas hydrophila TaxID=644 RepID=UPI00080AA9EF|nr:hypothetical protein [Aeromonas hydrophila]ANT70196.1 hypothetical protein TK34_22225 [Aeromonas hydrophila]